MKSLFASVAAIALVAAPVFARDVVREVGRLWAIGYCLQIKNNYSEESTRRAIGEILLERGLPVSLVNDERVLQYAAEKIYRQGCARVLDTTKPWD